MPINIERQVDLQPYNTFKVKVKALYMARINSIQDIHELISSSIFKENKHFILGGGSNVLLLQDFDGLVIKSEEKNLDILKETESYIRIKVTSGMIWHDLVKFCISKNWGGVENLSLIPGTVGAAPIQNIGAYGIEIKSVVENVDGIDLNSGQKYSITNDDCKFSYRDSIFKHRLRDNFFISSVTLRLTKKNHSINYKYAALKDHLAHSKIITPSIEDISKAVIEVRQNKLPDPSVIGNAGSFFKNPIVSKDKADSLLTTWPEIPIYQAENQLFKVPAGWLIERCGWKGKQMGNTGVHQHQALVIVNHGNANGEEIFRLSQKIRDDVKEKFNINLISEVNVIDKNL